MRRPLPVVLSSMVLISVTLLSVPVAAPRPQKAKPRIWSRSVFAPYYTMSQEFRAVLGMNNPTNKVLSIHPVMYSLSGVSFQVPRLELAPGESRKVDLGEWLAAAGSEFAKGSLQLTYQGEIPEFAAVLFLENEEKSLSVSNRLRARWGFRSTQLEGIWWAPNDRAEITVTLANTTDKKVVASLALSRRDGSRLRSLQVPLAPHQARVLNNRDLVAREGRLLGGLSITHDGTPGAILAQGFVVDKETGFSLNLPFFDPATSEDSKLEGTGVLLGTSMKEGEPPLRFSGRLLLRNVSLEPITATPAFQQGSARIELGELRLEPGASKEVAVSPDAVVPGTPPTGIQVRHTGDPGSLIGIWHSVDASGNLVVETPLSAPGPSGRTAGAHPFSLEGDTDSVLYIKNTGSATALFVAAVFYPGGDYMLGYHSVEPGETMAFDLRQIRDQQVPDFRGRVLPRDLMAAQVQWFWRGGPAIIGRMNLMSRSKGISNNMSCTLCGNCNPRGASLSFQPSIVDGAVGQIVNLEPVITEQMCSGNEITGDYGGALDYISFDPDVADVLNSSGQVACFSAGSTEIDATGEYPVYDAEFSECEGGPCEPICSNRIEPLFAAASVRVKPRIDNVNPNSVLAGSNNVQVTITGAGFGSSPTVNLPAGVDSSGQGATNTQIVITVNVAVSTTIGATSISVTANDQTSNSKAFTIDGPHHMVVQSDVLGLCEGCTTTVKRDVTYQIIRFSGSPETSVPIGESPLLSGWSCNQAEPGISFAPCSAGVFTASDGTFTDRWSMSSDGWTPTGCGFNITDPWKWCAPTPPKTVGTLTGFVHTDAVKINGVTNPPNQFTPGTVINP